MSNLSTRTCPVCQGKAKVQHLPVEAMHVDTSDIHDCPVCVDGEIHSFFLMSDKEKIKLDEALIDAYPQYCAI